VPSGEGWKLAGETSTCDGRKIKEGVSKSTKKITFRPAEHRAQNLGTEELKKPEVPA